MSRLLAVFLAVGILAVFGLHLFFGRVFCRDEALTRHLVDQVSLRIVPHLKSRRTTRQADQISLFAAIVFAATATRVSAAIRALVAVGGCTLPSSDLNVHGCGELLFILAHRWPSTEHVTRGGTSAAPVPSAALR